MLSQSGSRLLLLCGVVALISACSKTADSPVPILLDPPKAQPSTFASLEAAGEKGEIKAQLEVARRLDTGEGVAKDREKAFGWFLKAAQGGNPDAMAEVARRCRDGIGTDESGEQADKWWGKAAEAGNAEGQYEHSTEFGRATRTGAVIRGDKGDPAANATAMLAWLGKSEAQNYLPARYSLGMTYMLGATEYGRSPPKQLIAPERAKGLTLLTSAADAGYWRAQWALAVLYQAGFKEIKADKVLSTKYWGLLAAQKQAEDQERIATLYYEADKTKYVTGRNKYDGRDLSFNDTNSVALEWFQKAADQKQPRAQYAVAYMTINGEGTEKNVQKGLELMKVAGSNGSRDAQKVLGFRYLDGNGVVRDYVEAAKWLEMAAADKDQSPDAPVHMIRNALGVLNEYGWGRDKDDVVAYAWYNIAAAGNYKKAKENLARVEKRLKPEDLQEAQALSREWVPGKPMQRASTSKKASTETAGAAETNSKGGKPVGTGTGFFVTQEGHVLTNHHVVENCKEVRVAGDNLLATLVVADPANDLAVLKVTKSETFSATFPDTDDLKQGESVLVFGFPLDGFLTVAGNITPGIVSALAGPGNNSSLIQITAPVQPGNSGGPVFNMKGMVVGVVVGKADVLKLAKFTGDIAQNVNFAISPRTVKAFLDGNKIAYVKKHEYFFTRSKDTTAVADEARKVSVKLECWR